MRQLADETGGRSFFPARIEDLNGVYGQIADELASQYTVGYTPRNPRRDGAWRRVVVQVARPNADPRTKRGYYATSVNLLPLVLYASAGVVYAVHFARRQAPIGRAATTLLLLGVLAHTFVIGMQTMEVRHVPFANPSRAISTFVWLLALSYLYLEVTTDERAMGVFILPDRHRPADHSGAESRRREHRSASSTARSSGSTWRRCCSPTRASRWPACWA